MESLHVRYRTHYFHCNFSCEYCIAGHSSQVKAPDWDAARYRKVIANLAHLPYRLKVRIAVAGEIFLNHELVDGARELSRAANLEALNLITNLSLPLAQYQRIFEGFRIERTAVVASFHPSQVRDYDSWLRTAKVLAGQMDFCVVLVAYPPFLGDLSAHVSWLKQNGIETFVQPFIGVWNGQVYPRSYNAEERRLVRSVMYSAHDVGYLLDLKKPGLCNAGHTAIYVHDSGVVYPCGSGTYAEPIGDLSRGPELRLSRQPQLCPFATCQCDTDTFNTVEFQTSYRLTGINQHKYVPAVNANHPATPEDRVLYTPGGNVMNELFRVL